jgi:spore maturation protein A
MLNHIWLALLVIGILTAAGRDIYDESANTYGNDIPWEADPSILERITAPGTYQLPIGISAVQLERHFPSQRFHDGITIDARVETHDGRTGAVYLTIGDQHPERLRTMAELLGQDGALRMKLRLLTINGRRACLLDADRLTMVYLKRVTTAAFDIAGTAVQIAFGLIGIMALWLGVMRVAEQAGLIARLARAVRPITGRLFPGVPEDHPAVGSMIMNISANLLGLGNAATPFGLKAMEELERLNPKPGVATDAMVTFLALNTSCVTLIPATAIAVRAATGSADPAIIISTTFLASLTATVFALTTARLLGRVRWWRWDRQPEEGAA